MGHLSNLLNGLVKSLSTGKGKASAWPGTNSGRDAADAIARDARRNDMIFRSSGAMAGEGSDGCSVSVFSRRGEKGVNQDCCIVWKVMVFLLASPQVNNRVDQNPSAHVNLVICTSIMCEWACALCIFVSFCFPITGLDLYALAV